MKLPKIDIRWNYVFFSYELPYVHKPGISENVEQRRLRVQQTLREAYGNERIVLRTAIAFPSLFSTAQEARIHRVFTWFRLKHNYIPRTVSGYSEFFWYLNPVFGTALFFVLRHFGVDVNVRDIFIFALIPVYPVDVVLVVFALSLIEVVLFIVTVVAVSFISFHAYQFFIL
jgi:hypothetical protein